MFIETHQNLDYENLSEEKILDLLECIIYDYDDFFDKWINEEDANDYAEEFDCLRNTSLELTYQLWEKMKSRKGKKVEF